MLASILLSCKAIITIASKKQILSFASIPLISFRSLRIYRLYHLNIFNIFHSIVAMLHYYLLMMSMITLYSAATAVDFFVASVFLIYFSLFSWLNIRNAKTYFCDEKCNNCILNRSPEEQQRLTL